GRRHCNRAFGAKDTHDILRIHLNSSEQLREDTAREGQRGDSVFIHARNFADVTAPRDLDWISKVFASSNTGNEPDHRCTIATDIEDTTTTKGVVQQPTLRAEMGVETE